MPGEIKKLVRYYLQKRKKWDGDSNFDRPIVLSFHYDSKVLCSLTGLRCSIANWDKSMQRINVKTVKRASKANQILDLYEQKINDAYFDCLANGKPVTNEILLKALKGEKPREQLSFWQEWEKYFEIHKNKHGKGTIKSMKTSYNRFKEFMKGRDIGFDQINPELLSKYNEFLLQVGNVNATVQGNIKRLKIFLNYAKKIGLHNNDLYRQYNISLPDGNIKFLEWKEVKMMLDIKLDSQMEQDARDLFCFSCLTGLRYSDVSELRYSQIKEHRFEEMEEVQYAVHVNQIKTHKPAVAPLLKEALEIIARHKGKDKEFALPQRELQSVNRTLKIVAKKAGINSQQEIITYRGNQREVKTKFKHELISTHWARRTFCTCASLKGIPITVACSITGLSPKVMLKHYMGVIDVKKFEEVQKKLQF